MKSLLPAILVLLFAGCSKPPETSPDTRTYSVTFAVALLPNSILKDFGGTFSENKGYNFDSLTDRYRLAQYVLDNPERFSVVRQGGSWIPLVGTGAKSQMELRSAQAAEKFSLEKNGVALERFKAVIVVYDENASGQIRCNWSCDYSLTLQVPVGNSTRHGGQRSSGYVLRSGQPDMTPFFNFDENTLWLIVGLNRK